MTLTRCLRSLGNSSMIEAMKASQDPQTDEMASRMSMKKKRKEKNGGASILVTASGYTTKARPGPES